MAGLFDAIGTLRGRMEGSREAARASILQPLLERLSEQQRVRDREALKGSTGRGGVLSQFGPETAGQIGPLLESDNPQMQALGSSLLGQLVGAKAAPKGLPLDERMMTPAQRVGAQDQRSQFDRSYALEKQRTDTTIRNLNQGYEQNAALFPLQMRQAEQAIAASKAQIDASGLSADAKNLTFVNTVRGQYQALPAIKTAVEAQGAYRAASQAASQGSALGAEIALIKMAKLADPTSVVREGETERIRSGYGLISQLAAELRKAGSQGMTTEQRAMYMDVLDTLYGPAMEQAAGATRAYMQLEDQYKTRPGEIVNSVGLDWSLTPGSWRQGPSGNPGQVRQW